MRTYDLRTYDLKKRHGVDGASFKTGGGNDIIGFLCGGETGQLPEGFGDTGNYLKSLQQEDGSSGWSSVPQHSYVSLENAFYAVLSLKAIGCEDETVFEKAKEYMLDNRHGDGIFGDDRKPLKDTAYAILTLRAIGYGDRDGFEKSCEFMMSCRNPDGGFGLAAGDTSDIKSTAFALLALKAAGTPDDRMPDSRKYVMGLKWDDGGFGPKGGHVNGSSARETSYAILALRAMGEPAMAIPEETRNYVKKRSPEKCAHIMDIHSTAFSLFALGEDIDEAYARRAKRLQLGDGSFKWSGIDDDGNVMNTFYGVMTVKAAHKK